MTALRFESASDPTATPEVLEAITRLIVRLEAMGLLAGLKLPPAPDLDLVRRVGRIMSQRGIARASTARLLAPNFRSSVHLRRTLEALLRDLDASPVPDSEWSALVETLDADLLAGLVGVSPSSVRRYASGKRRTPDDIAERLHFVALIVGELAGAYNEIGVRRWFARPRTALRGKTPGAVLSRDWTPDDEGPKRVRALAESLAGSPAS